MLSNSLLAFLALSSVTLVQDSDTPLRVQVRDEHDAPIPNAVVHTIERTLIHRHAWRNDGSSHGDLARRFGRLMTADEKGWIQFPEGVREETILVYREPGRSGYLVLRPTSSGDVAMRLVRYRTFPVRVVDPRGQPVVGIPVVVRFRAPSWEVNRSRVVTNEEGIAHVGHGWKPLRPDGHHVITVGAVLRAPPEDSLPASPDTPVTLIVPELGIVAVTREDPRYARQGFPILLALRAMTPEMEDPTFALESRDMRFERRLPEFEPATFQHVEVGTRLELLIGRSHRGWTRRVVDGPPTAGETVHVHVSAPLRHPVITGRLEDDTGPLVEAGFTWRLRDRWQRMQTDESGQFTIELKDTRAHETKGEIEIAADDRELMAVCEPIDLTLETRVYDLGTLRLPARPVLVRGRVVDDLGRPIAGASVHLLEHIVAEDGRPEQIRRFDHSLDVPSGVRTNARGEFEMLGAVPSNLRFRAHTFHQGFLPPSAEGALLEPGSEDAVVVLPRGGALQGRVLLDAHVDPRHVGLRLKCPGDTQTRFASLNPDGTFRVHPLPAGTAWLEVRLLGGTRDGLRTIEDLIIKRGATNEDARLQAIDLRGRIHVHRVQVRGEDGTSLGAVTITDARTGAMLAQRGVDSPQRGSYRGPGDIVPPRPGQPPRPANLRMGPFYPRKRELPALMERRPTGAQPMEVVTTKTSIDLRISGPGLRSRTLEDASGDEDVTLARGPRLRIVVDPFPRLEPPYEIHAFADGTWPPRLWFDEDGTCAVFLSENETTVRFALLDETRGKAFYVPVRWGNVVQEAWNVDPTSDPLELRVAIPEVELRHALETLRGLR